MQGINRRICLMKKKKNRKNLGKILGKYYKTRMFKFLI